MRIGNRSGLMAALFSGVLLACGGSANVPDTGTGMDAGRRPDDAEASDAAEPLDAEPLDAEPVDAEPLDAQGLDASGPLDAQAGAADAFDAQIADAADALDAQAGAADALDAQAGAADALDAQITDADDALDAATPDAGPSLAERCQRGCDHLAECGMSCAGFGVTCSGATAELACLGDCAARTPCAELGPEALAACNASCPRSDGGPPSCETCVVSACGDEITACFADGACFQQVNCVASCADSACVDACVLDFPASESLTGPVYACSCTSCAGACSGEPICAPPSR
jgi:hypothetical protein